ncbi:hypothetical protein [Pseudonocardia halophobica]|uniref:hypothetical protein n=1 Tax=Pseudonocardia halophobica TaxID=29401 RepID=UPI000560B4AC
MQDDADQAQLLRGRKALRPIATAMITGGRDQRVHVGDRIYVGGPRQRAAEAGQVREERLELLREQYVAVPGYDEMLTALDARRLLVLVGHPGSGRATTGLHLLDTVSEGKVFRLGPGTDLGDVDEQTIAEGTGTLAEITERRLPPTEAQADRLAALLQRRRGYFVLVAPPTPAVLHALGDYLLECAPPPYEALLQGLLELHRRPDDIMTVDELLRCAEAPEVREALGPTPRPAEIAGLALLLVDHMKERLTLEELRTAAAGFLSRRIAEYFADLGESVRRDVTERRLRTAALRMALAVFDDLPLHIMSTAAADLADLLVHAGGNAPTLGRPVVSETDDTVLAALDAETAEGDVTMDGVPVPSQVVRYRDRRTPAVLLTYVWQRHLPLREPVVEWLWRLSAHPQALVRNRAAQAAGLLAAADFTHTFPALIARAAEVRPPARAHDPDRDTPDDDDADDETWIGRRTFAALALDHAALDERTREVVEAQLRRWRRSDELALRWTAARCLGYGIGKRSIDRSFEELRVIGTPWELIAPDDVPGRHAAQVWDLRLVSALSAARLFANADDRHAVLRKVRDWLSHERPSVRELGQQCVVLMAGLRMSSIGSDTEVFGDQPRTQADRRRWPILLGLPNEDGRLWEPVGDILRSVLSERFAGSVLMNSIGSWWQIAEDDPATLDAFLGLVPHLVDGERDRRRLLHAVDSRRRRWADPLSPRSAERITAAIAATASREGASA